MTPGEYPQRLITWLHEYRAAFFKADPVFVFRPYGISPLEAFWFDGQEYEDERPRIVLHRFYKEREQELIDFFAAKRDERRTKIEEALFTRHPDPYTLDLERLHS